MGSIELTEGFLAKIAGWEAMKQARALLAAQRVLHSDWTSPVLKGAIQEGANTLRAGLIIHDAINVENLCPCRASRQRGMICAHAVAVGLHHLSRGQSDRLKIPTAPLTTAASNKIGLPTLTRSTLSSINRLRYQTVPHGSDAAALQLIFPPNLEESIRRGRIQICCEVRWRQNRWALNAIPAEVVLGLSPQDSAILDWLTATAGDQIPAVLSLDLDAMAALLGRLIGHPRLTKGRNTELRVRQEAWRLPVKAVLEPNGEVTLHCLLQTAPLRIPVKPNLTTTGSMASMPPMVPATLESVHSEPTLMQSAVSFWIFDHQEFRPCHVPDTYASLFEKTLRLTRVQVPALVGGDWPILEQSCRWESNFQPEDFTLKPCRPKFHLHLSGGLAQLSARLHFVYDAFQIVAGRSAAFMEEIWIPDPQNARTYSIRDLSLENAALGRLHQCGFQGPDAQNCLRLTGQERVLNFFARTYPRLQREWHITMEERIEKNTLGQCERVEPQLDIIPSGENWFEMTISFASSSGQHLSMADIQQLMGSGQSHRRLANGRWAIMDTELLDEFQEVLRDCQPQQQNQRYRVPQAQAGFLTATLNQTGWQVRAPDSWRSEMARWHGESKPPLPALGTLASQLRPYQATGVAWLWLLRQHGFGGILADEMGLGKTLQALALLQGIFLQNPAAMSLIVCPTSLVWNWEAEARRFTPDLRVLCLTGVDRQAKWQYRTECQAVITTYSLLRRDAELYREELFDTVILDEAQHIKNRQTQNAQAVKALRARHRVVLTGTPLENSVADLWSIFDFLMPDYLGSSRDFRQRYELPILRDRDAAVQNRLARRVRPFLLRRLKSGVAPELPEKLEQVVYCELTTEQAQVYQELLTATQRELTTLSDTQGLARRRLFIFNALLRLRQVCCDLRLLNLERTEPTTASGKLELLMELLDEVLDGGHRVLIFSQFVKMLSLIKTQLESRQIGFCYLDGSTPDRAQVVSQFQRTPDLPVFLISLRAGGLGLNLTGADTVIHYDPWWNPAIEEQATDRIHRIGQTRLVTSYKLIARGTIEEKIWQLQQRKKILIRQSLGEEADLAQVLSWEEIQALLV